MLSKYFLPCDAYFYSQYAKPLVSTYSSLFDLNGFDDHQDANNNSTKEFSQRFTEFKRDSPAQYEMHPKFGRYCWDIGDQWYQKWNVVLSMEHMWHWSKQSPTQLDDPYTLERLQPWLNHITQRHRIHPHHRQFLESICGYLISWQKSNKYLSSAGTIRLNTIPFYPPSWFTEKQLQSNVEEGDHLASSYFARFVPPYRLDVVPERWNHVFLKGLTYDPTNEKFNVDPSLIASIIPLYGLTVHFDEATGYSYLMMVTRKAAFGNLETNLQKVIPNDYEKIRRQALSITKSVKDLHWGYIHGNVHPRNILFNFDDTIAELVDATFMKQKQSTSSVNSSSSTISTMTTNTDDAVITTSTTTTTRNTATPVLPTPTLTPPTSPNELSISSMDPEHHHRHPHQSYLEDIDRQTQKIGHPFFSCIKHKKGGMSGRWPYVAPEVAKGLTGPTTEADIYSLGVILWQLVSRITFPANAPVDPYVFRIEPIPGVLPDWEELYAACLSSDPAKRPSAYMVYRRLEKIKVTLSEPNATQQTTLLPIDQRVLDYVQQRRKEIDAFMEEHQDQFSSPHQRLTKLRENVILTASVTRSINHGLESYPSPVQGFSTHTAC